MAGRLEPPNRVRSPVLPLIDKPTGEQTMDSIQEIKEEVLKVLETRANNMSPEEYETLLIEIGEDIEVRLASFVDDVPFDEDDDEYGY